MNTISIFLRVEMAQSIGQFAAVHVGHDHVGDEQIDPAGPLLRQTQGFARGARRQDPIAQSLQHHFAQSHDRRLVLHQQHRLAPPPRHLSGAVRARRLDFALVPRQVDLEGRPLSRFAADVDEAFVLLEAGAGHLMLL